MTARLLDGRALGRSLNKALKGRAAALSRPPGLAVVLVGDDPASQVYVRRKGIVAGRLGFGHWQVDLPAATTQGELLAVLDDLQSRDEVDGVLVQLPLPRHFSEDAIIARIEPARDVDGFHPVNAGLLAMGRPGIVSCTPLGVMRLLEHGEVSLEGANAVVIGRSNIVGRPVAHLLEQRNATVTVCHSRTRDLPGVVSRADVVVAAVGRAELVRGEWLKPGAAVIDVGINRLDDGRLAGDVHFESAVEVAGAITPVPGGVGPMTISMLMENTWRCSARRQGLDV